ncbi:MAG: hypothetical protein M1823_004087 [Watsoniomyces obsoletus]|nr:MAG: hypothetical protein M1823_004087 [Watsoniomyces obsoletus]
MIKDNFSMLSTLLVGCCLVLSSTAVTLFPRAVEPICPLFPDLPEHIERPPSNEFLQAVFMIDGPMRFQCMGNRGWQQTGSLPGELRVFNYGAVLRQQHQQEQQQGGTRSVVRATRMAAINPYKAVALPRSQIGPEIGYLVITPNVNPAGWKPGDATGVKHSLCLWADGASSTPSTDDNGSKSTKQKGELLWTSIESHPPVDGRSPVPNQPGYLPPHPLLQKSLHQKMASVRGYRLWQSYQEIPTGKKCSKTGEGMRVPFRAIYVFYGPKGSQLVSESGLNWMQGMCRP